MSSYTGRSEMLTSCLQAIKYGVEEESESELAIAIERRHRISVESRKSEKSAGVSSASLALLEENEKLQQRLAKLLKEAEEGDNKPTRPSRPLGMSSASESLQRRNVELVNQVARLEYLKQTEWSEGSVRLTETESSEGSVRLTGREKLRLIDKRTDEKIRNLELKKMLEQAQELDLAFLMDATSSMEKPILEVKNLAPKIANDVKKAFPKLKLRVAFVPYRDYAEYHYDEAEKCDFTDSFQGPESVFVSAVAKVRAWGGGDPPEDVFSGLERVATLNWRSKTRVLIHIADAPCHGEEFHDRPREDWYPNGDWKRRDISKLLATLRHDCQISNYLFCHINIYTKKMLRVFRERAPQGGWIHEEKLDNINDLLKVVVGASSQSIARSSRIVGEGPSVSKYLPVPLTKEIPLWNAVNWQQAVQISYKFPATLEELFKMVDRNRSLVELVEQKPDLTVKIAPRTFSDEGMMRWPYHAQVHETLACSPRTSPRKMVVKRFKELVGQDVSKMHTLEAYCEQMEVQTVAAFMATHFNQELERLSGPTDYKKVQFTAVSVLQVGGSTFYNMEQWLDGKWIRYSNNVNYVNTEEYAATLHAFSHWTYQRSRGLLMVTDLQGVQVKDSQGKNVFMLCDPAVHCKHVYRYSRTKTNWSYAGMDSFFETHRCNNICRSLQLIPKSSDFTSQGTVIN